MIYISVSGVLSWCVMSDRTVCQRSLNSPSDKENLPLVSKKVSVPSRSFAAFDSSDDAGSRWGVVCSGLVCSGSFA
jgi:hypothetical protein